VAGILGPGVKLDAMQIHQPRQTILRGLTCRPSADEDHIEVLNENNFVMGHYNRRTGGFYWERLVLATQRESIQRWFAEHYPVTKRTESSPRLDTVSKKSVSAKHKLASLPKSAPKRPASKRHAK
jgi:hypothetical protein